MCKLWTCNAILNFCSGTPHISLNHFIISKIIFSSELVNFTFSCLCLSPSAQYKHSPARNNGFFIKPWNSWRPMLMAVAVSDNLFFLRLSAAKYRDNSLPFNNFLFAASFNTTSRNQRLSVDLETLIFLRILLYAIPLLRRVTAFIFSFSFTFQI